MSTKIIHKFYKSDRSGGILMFINNNFNNFTGYRPKFGNEKPLSNNYQPTQNKEVHIKDLYANDMHGILNGYRKLMTVKDSFDAQAKNNPDIIASTYLSGDGRVGANRKKNELIVALENFLNPRYKTPGNHDFDDEGAEGFSKLLDKSKDKTLALNLITSNNSVVDDDIKTGRLAKSAVFEQNGEKFGVIGLIPTDLYKRLNQQSKDKSKDIDVLNLPETIKAVQKEVDKLEAQKVNKITVLSHMGYPADVALAKAVNGVDIIHGAHTHDVLKGLEPNKNYFISKRGEPVIITQAGKHGHWFGLLDVVYDKNGKIIKAKNDVKSLDNVSDSLKAVTAEKIIIGEPKKIGELVQDVKSMPEAEWDESPMCSFLCEAYKKLTNADIVLNNAGTMRNTLHKGDITDRTIIDMMPYYNNISTYKLSEKDVIDAINSGLEVSKKSHRTGALQVAGMTYVIGKNGKVKEAEFIKNDGTKEKINTENPRADKFYTVAYNSFLSGGTDGLEILNAPDKKIKTFDANETDLLIDYIKSFNGKPLLIEKDGRITTEK